MAQRFKSRWATKKRPEKHHEFQGGKGENPGQPTPY